MLYGKAHPELDKTLWNYLSATMHGTWYALVQSIRVTGTEDPFDTDGWVGGVLISSNVLTMCTVVAWRACANGVDGRAELMGWKRSQAHDRAHTALAELEAQWYAGWKLEQQTDCPGVASAGDTEAKDSGG